MAIRNPAEWSSDQLRNVGGALRATGHRLHRPAVELETRHPAVNRIGLSDLGECLRRGLADFGASRSDVLFIALFYPLAGLVLVRLAFGLDFLPLVFPLAAGVTLLGPFAAAGLYELSRRREIGENVSTAQAFAGVLRHPSIGAMVELGLVLTVIFLFWLGTSVVIYNLTLGPSPPASVRGFVEAVLSTPQGWELVFFGWAAGLAFALVVLAIGSISFPMLLDRPVSVATAIRTSVRALVVNPVPILAWGLIVAGGLLIGAIPLLWGLIIVVPVLGHATWHLYRRIVE